MDNGSVIPVDHTLMVSPNSFNCKHIGTPQVVTLSVVDRFGGTQSSCTAMVNILDNIAPKLSCLKPEVLINEDGVDTLTADVYAGAIADNCGIDTVIISPNIFDCSHIGTTQLVTVEVRDESGNINSCVDTVFYC